MRVVVQLIAVVLIGAAAAGLWYWRDSAASTEGETRRGPPGGGAVAVEVAPARLGRVADVVEAVGTTMADEAVDVVAEVSGRVAAIGFEEGQDVAAGAVLVALDDTRQQAELREAVARRDDARTQYERALQLRQSNNVAQAQVDQLRAALEGAEAGVQVAEVALADRRILAPFDGVVGFRRVSPGAFVDSGTVITTLDDISTVVIDFAVPERYLARLRPGLPVAATTVVYEGTAFEGIVSGVDTRVEPATRTVRVQAAFPNADRRLRPGMFMTVELVLDARPEAVLVPEQALLVEGDTQSVYIVEDETARRVEVTTGLRENGEVEIVSGLQPGQTVVTAGLQRLRDGAAVRVLSTEEPTPPPDPQT